MRDQVQLRADLYTPSGEVRGTILVRSPYGRAGLMAMLFCRPFAMQGYRVLSVSCRATFGSGGELNAFTGEIDDGLDTVQWMREQPWFNGAFATMGTSYLGFTQWAILCEPPAELKAAVIVSGPHDSGRLLYDTGAMNVVSSVGWTHGMLNQGEHGPLRSFAQALAQRDRPYRGVLDGVPMSTAARASWGDRAFWFDAWAAHPDPTDPFWDTASVTVAHETTEIPVLLYSGWHDLILDQVLESYDALSARGIDVQLVMGPWSHADLTSKAAASITNDALGWFAEHLSHDGKRTSAARVRIQPGGTKDWRELDSWPPESTGKTLYLHPGGQLRYEPAPDAGASSRLRYDPADPTPAVGGMSNALDAGRRDNTDREKRADVITFTSDVLTQPLEIAGLPQAEIAYTTDNPHLDWLVRICEVDAKGHSWNVSEAYRRATESDGVLRVDLGAVAHRFGSGSRIRVQLSGGAHPVYERNLGTGERVTTSSAMRPSTRTIAHGRGGQSFVTLPVVSR
jgi:hypothetical protein